MKKLFFIILILILGVSGGFAQKNKKPNILFITIDDLRPELGVYGNEVIKSPNIDKLAGEGVMFLKAYAQVPVCGASRASMHTGIRPTKTRFTKAASDIDHDTPNAVTIGEYFKDNGYYTVSIGKVIHGKYDASKRSWSKYYPAENMFEYHTKDNLEYNKHPEKGYKRSYPYEITPDSVPDTAFLDVRTLNNAIKELKTAKKKGKPFLLAVGFARPHLPFVAPKRYWDLYSKDDIKEPDNYYYPKDVPKIAISSWGELRAYRGIPKKGDITDKEMRLTLKHGYYASVSFIDDLVGTLIKEVKKLGLYDNTIIVLWGDHGWQLGEHKEWAKHTNFDIALRVPFIVIAPDKLKGQVSNELVEMVDVFPTLSELAGLPVLEQNQGKSIVPILEGKHQEMVFALSRWQSGDSYKTDRYRYTEFTNKDGKVIARMLFDHKKDPEENVNVANLPEYQKVVEKLSKKLHKAQEEYNLK